MCTCLLTPKRIDLVLEHIRVPAHFFGLKCQRIWIALLAMNEAEMEIDLVTVAGWMRDHDQLDQIGGSEYLAGLTYKADNVDVEVHARKVAERALQRRTLTACHRLAAEGYKATDGYEYAADVEAQIFRVTSDKPSAQEKNDLATIVRDVVAPKEADNAVGAPTFLPELDDMIIGWRPTKMYVIAGRPGQGKSCFSTNAVVHFSATTGKAAVIVSLEMPKGEIGARMIAAEASCSFQDLERGNVGGQWGAVAAAADKLSKLPIAIVYEPGASLSDVRSIIRRENGRLERKFGRDLELGMFVVDYLQLMRGNPRAGNREQAIAEISRELKALAGSENAAALVLSQLNREVDKRPNKRPVLSDLRESGAIEQDADVVLFPYRPRVYSDTAPAAAADLTVAKQRGGDTGSINMTFTPYCMRFAPHVDGASTTNEDTWDNRADTHG